MLEQTGDVHPVDWERIQVPVILPQLAQKVLEMNQSQVIPLTDLSVQGDEIMQLLSDELGQQSAYNPHQDHSGSAIYHCTGINHFIRELIFMHPPPLGGELLPALFYICFIRRPIRAPALQQHCEEYDEMLLDLLIFKVMVFVPAAITGWG